MPNQPTYHSQVLDHLGLVAGMFDELAIGDAQHVERLDFDMLTSWRQALEITFVRALKPDVCDNLVCFGNQVVGHDMQVREGSKEHVQEQFGALKGHRHSGG